MEVNPVSTKRIYQSIIEQFIGLIISGKLSVGQKLPPERNLAEMFNVSRTSIREAFRTMEIIGLLEVRPGDGTFVTDLKIANFINTIAPLFVRDESMEKELLEFRKLLETEAVRLAAEKATEEKILPLREAIRLMTIAIEKNDYSLGSDADIMFHREIFGLTENYILKKASECVAYILESSVKFNREKILKNTDNTKELLRQHTMIFEAVRNNDPELAVEIMKKHLEFVLKMS